MSYLNIIPTSHVQIPAAVSSRPHIDVLLHVEGGVERHPDVLARAADDDLQSMQGFYRTYSMGMAVIWFIIGLLLYSPAQTSWEIDKYQGVDIAVRPLEVRRSL